MKKTSGKEGKCEKEEKEEELAEKVGEDQDKGETNGRRGRERELEGGVKVGRNWEKADERES